MNLVLVIVIILCALLIALILIQNPKGGGLSSSIGGFSNQTMGVQRTTETLVKATWTVMGIIALLVLISNTSLMNGKSDSGAKEENMDINKRYPGEPMLPNANTAPLPVQGGQQTVPAGEGSEVQIEAPAQTENIEETPQEEN